MEPTAQRPCLCKSIWKKHDVAASWRIHLKVIWDCGAPVLVLHIWFRLADASQTSANVKNALFCVYKGHFTSRVKKVATEWKWKEKSCMRARAAGLISECGAVSRHTFDWLSTRCRVLIWCVLWTAAARMPTGSFRGGSSTDVWLTPHWLAPQIMFHFLPHWSSQLTSFTAFLLRIDSDVWRTI